MIVRALDSLGDWTFGKGKNNYLRDKDALIQSLKTRILSWQGDCFFAKQDFVDWNNLLDIGTKDLLDMEINRVILQTQGVLKINSNVSIVNERNYSAQIDINTVYGTIQLEV